MTIKADKSSKTAITRSADEEQEQEAVPSYQEAVSSASSSAPTQQTVSDTASSSVPSKGAAVIPPPSSASAAAAAPSSQQQPTNLYPFPSLPSQHGYGQTPYPSDGTVRIAIVQGQGLLPLHATSIRQGPSAGKRFLLAFCWALLLYMIMASITGAIVGEVERSHQPKTPPGWKHHHKKPDQWPKLFQ